MRKKSCTSGLMGAEPESRCCTRPPRRALTAANTSVLRLRKDSGGEQKRPDGRDHVCVCECVRARRLMVVCAAERGRRKRRRIHVLPQPVRNVAVPESLLLGGDGGLRQPLTGRQLGKEDGVLTSNRYLETPPLAATLAVTLS